MSLSKELVCQQNKSQQGKILFFMALTKVIYNRYGMVKPNYLPCQVIIKIRGLGTKTIWVWMINCNILCMKLLKITLSCSLMSMMACFMMQKIFCI